MFYIPWMVISGEHNIKEKVFQFLIFELLNKKLHKLIVHKHIHFCKPLLVETSISRRWPWVSPALVRARGREKRLFIL